MAEIGVPKAPRSYALRLVGPFARISPRTRGCIGYFCIAAAALLFPLVNQNDADIDSAANALAFAALALGLNIVVGFAGLLDLGYAAFFAIGSYAYAYAASPFGNQILGIDVHAALGDAAGRPVSSSATDPGNAAAASRGRRPRG